MVTVLILSCIAFLIIMTCVVIVSFKEQADRRNEEYQKDAKRIREAFTNMIEESE